MRSLAIRFFGPPVGTNYPPSSFSLPFVSLLGLHCLGWLGFIEVLLAWWTFGWEQELSVAEANARQLSEPSTEIVIRTPVEDYVTIDTRPSFPSTQPSYQEAGVQTDRTGSQGAGEVGAGEKFVLIDEVVLAPSHDLFFLCDP